MHVQHSVTMHLDATLEQAWALMADPRRVAEWHTQVLEVRDVREAAGPVGKTMIYRQSVPGGEHDFRVEVTGWEDGRSITTVGVEVGGGQTWTSAVRFERDGAGTSFAYSLETEIPGNRVVGALAGRLIEGSIDRWMHKSMENFAELAKKVLQPA